jgi:processive 1,2-diacylglycerol beta-glucosyltransferase
MSFESIAIELTNKKYFEYAYSLVNNKEDAEDLVSDLVLIVHKKVQYFSNAKEKGYLTQAVKICLKNLVRDKFRAKKTIDPRDIDTSTKTIPDNQKWALKKLKEDSDRTDYYPLLFNKMIEFGGVIELSKATGISKDTIYTGIKKYKTDVMNIKKVLLITPHEVGGVGYHRILKPYAELKEVRNDILLTRSNAYVNQGHDVVIFNRVCAQTYEQERSIMNEAKMCGQKVIVDIDDYWELPSGHILEHYYAKNQLSKRIAQNIKEADVVTCTNEVLALRILKLNKNVEVIPNALKESDQQWANLHQPDSTYRFGFVGSRAHTTDVPLLRKGCNLMNKGKSDFKFIFVGYHENDSTSKLFEEVFTSRGTSDRYGKIGVKPVNEYGMSYNIIDCSLAPLEDNLFNRCKSNLKVLEASAHSIPIICSKIHPYFGAEFDDVVYFCESEYDWYKRMSHLVKNPNEGIERGKIMNQIFLENYTYKVVNKLRNQLI